MLHDPPTELPAVGFSLGSNAGDRLAMLESACDYLSDVFGALRLSQVYETEPVGCPPGSPNYLNACVVVHSNMQPEEILKLCLDIEKALGRERSGVYGEPRCCDIDLLFCGDRVMDTPDLTLPHPRAHQRAFVLRPLCDIDPGIILPGQADTVQTLLDKLPDSPAVTPFNL